MLEYSEKKIGQYQGCWYPVLSRSPSAIFLALTNPCLLGWTISTTGVVQMSRIVCKWIAYVKQEFRYSPNLKLIYVKFLSGQFPSGCPACYHHDMIDTFRLMSKHLLIKSLKKNGGFSETSLYVFHIRENIHKAMCPSGATIVTTCRILIKYWYTQEIISPLAIKELTNIPCVKMLITRCDWIASNICYYRKLRHHGLSTEDMLSDTGQKQIIVFITVVEEA